MSATKAMRAVEVDVEREIEPDFSLATARGIVKDLFTPQPAIYWADFLATILAGHACYTLVRQTPALLARFAPESSAWLAWGVRGIFFALACVLYFRAVSFIHELAHLPERKFRKFRIAWNLLCGLPFLVPSSMYYPHIDHHRRKVFGTPHDGEYLPLASGSPWGIVAFLSQCLWVGPLVVVRFMLLAPLSWCAAPLRRWLYERASSLVINPHYLRPAPTASAQRILRLQEVLCCLICWGVALVPPLVLQRWPMAFVVQAYLASVVVVFLNSLRTLAAHRYAGDGHEATLLAHLLDSVNVDDRSLLGCILNPVGLRYHALHHLFPSIPYHHLGTAHRRLLAELPADSPYRETVEPSVQAAIAALWRRTRASSRQGVARNRDSAERAHNVRLEPSSTAPHARG